MNRNILLGLAFSLASCTGTMGAIKVHEEMSPDIKHREIIDKSVVAKVSYVATKEVKIVKDTPTVGCCSYPHFTPCWCAQSNIGGVGGCQSAEQYLNDVDYFGPPRCGMRPDFPINGVYYDE